LANLCRALGFVCFETGHSGAKAFRIELANSKCSNTALRASWATRQPLATAMCCVIKRIVDDLHELAIARREHIQKQDKIDRQFFMST
jgi:hypothetical protein